MDQLNVDDFLPEYTWPALTAAWEKLVKSAGPDRPVSPLVIDILDDPKVDLGDDAYCIGLDTSDMEYRGLEDFLVADEPNYIFCDVDPAFLPGILTHPQFLTTLEPHLTAARSQFLFSYLDPAKVKAYGDQSSKVYNYEYVEKLIRECQLGQKPWWVVLARDWDTDLAYTGLLVERSLRRVRKALGRPKVLSPEQEAEEYAIRLDSWSDGWAGDGPVPPMPEHY